MRLSLSLIAVAVLLSACQLALPGKTPAEAVTPITTGQISVTPLDAPVVVEQTAVQEAEPAAAPEQAVADPETTDTLPPVAPAPLQKSASQLACEKRDGAWVAAGTTGTMSCQTPQRDGGKQCSRDSDCAGQCLARSQTCAPFAPLFGCNEVLQDNGQRVTLCIE